MGNIDDLKHSLNYTPGCNCPYCDSVGVNFLTVYANHVSSWYCVNGMYKFSNSSPNLPDGVIHLRGKPAPPWQTELANDPYGCRTTQYIDEFDFVLAGCWAKYKPVVYLRRLDVVIEKPDFWVKNATANPPFVCSSNYMEAQRELRLAQLYPKDFPQLAAQYGVNPYTPVPVPSLIPNAKASPKTGFSGVHIEGENGKIIMAPPPRTGYACQKCQSFNEYAAANAPGDAYICYNCRVVL